MVLELRSNCERCKSTLGHQAEAYICSYECTFCRDCTDGMKGVCPNCGGELVRRPKRRTG